jgi:hypothetical protein
LHDQVDHLDHFAHFPNCTAPFSIRFRSVFNPLSIRYQSIIEPILYLIPPSYALTSCHSLPSSPFRSTAIVLSFSSVFGFYLLFSLFGVFFKWQYRCA